MSNGIESVRSLPEAIIALRKAHGSHDKLAQRLGTSRQTIIRWEKGSRPDLFYRTQLIELGVPEDLLERRVSQDELDRRLRRVEGELAELRRLLDEL